MRAPWAVHCEIAVRWPSLRNVGKSLKLMRKSQIFSGSQGLSKRIWLRLSQANARLARAIGGAAGEHRLEQVAHVGVPRQELVPARPEFARGPLEVGGERALEAIEFRRHGSGS